MNNRPMTDPYLHLADALAEDILKSSDEELLSEAAEDFGGHYALSVKFDEILASIPQLQDAKAQSLLAPSQQEGWLAELKRSWAAASLKVAAEFRTARDAIAKAAQNLSVPQRYAFGQWVAAAIVLGVGIGYGGAVLTRPEPPVPGWRAMVASYQSLYTKETLALLSADQVAQSSDIKAVSAKLGLALTPETLQVQGLELKRALLLQFKGRPLAQFEYLDGKGIAIAFCAIPTKDPDSPVKTGQFDNLPAAFWNKGGFGFVVIGGAPIADLQRAANTLAMRIS